MNHADVAPAYHSVTLVFNLKGAEAFIDFCKGALGAVERLRRAQPDGTIVHADLQLGDTVFWVSEAVNDAPTVVAVAHFVDACDGVFERATRLGARAVFPPSSPPWGGRWARVVDEWGNQWTFVEAAEQGTETKGAGSTKD
jgi:PhnB protein